MGRSWKSEGVQVGRWTWHVAALLSKLAATSLVVDHRTSGQKEKWTVHLEPEIKHQERVTKETSGGGVLRDPAVLHLPPPSLETSQAEKLHGIIWKESHAENSFAMC